MALIYLNSCFFKASVYYWSFPASFNTSSTNIICTHLEIFFVLGLAWAPSYGARMHENNWTFKQLMARLISCWCVFFFLLQILFVSQLHYRDMAATASSGWDHTEPGKAWIAVTYSIIHIIWLNSNNSFGPLHFSLLPSTSFQAVLLVNSPKLAALVNLTVLLCSSASECRLLPVPIWQWQRGQLGKQR